MATTNGSPVMPKTKPRISLGRSRSIPKELIEFQPDAVEIEQRAVPGKARWTLYTVIALVISAIVWATVSRVDRVVVAKGELVTTVSQITIQPIAAVPIREIHVKFGDFVKAGDILATLDPTFSQADVAKLKARKSSFDATISRLTAESNRRAFSIAGHESDDDWKLEFQVYDTRRLQYDAKLETFAAERNNLNVQQKNNDREITSLQEQLEIHEKYQAKIKKLFEQNSESLLELWSSELRKGDAQRSLDTAVGKKSQFKEELKVNDKQKTAFITEWRSETAAELLTAQQQMSEITEELNKATRMDELTELRVPDDLEYKEFVVLEVADLSVGSVVKPSEPMFKLVPLNVPLEAEIEIPAKDIGRVTADATVRIKLDAFSYQKHGTLTGEVRLISEGAFQKGEGPNSTTMYRSRVSLGSTNQLKSLPRNFRLLPGMKLDAEIKVGDRRVIDFFLYPLFRYLDNSLDEP